jgi:hypothetical protein
VRDAAQRRQFLAEQFGEIIRAVPAGEARIVAVMEIIQAALGSLTDEERQAWADRFIHIVPIAPGPPGLRS